MDLVIDWQFHNHCVSNSGLFRPIFIKIFVSNFELVFVVVDMGYTLCLRRQFQVSSIIKILFIQLFRQRFNDIISQILQVKNCFYTLDVYLSFHFRYESLVHQISLTQKHPVLKLKSSFSVLSSIVFIQTSDFPLE